MASGSGSTTPTSSGPENKPPARLRPGFLRALYSTVIQSEEIVQIVSSNIRAVRDFIIANHYSAKTAPTSFAFAMLDDSGEIVGAVTFGQPASPWVAVSIRGREGVPVIELNRLAIRSSDRNAASRLIGYALRNLPRGLLVVSYADQGVGHVGYVYQATNWKYAGQSKERTDIYSESGHARHHCGDRSRRQPRSAKHRYWIATSRHAERSSLWPSLAYPKGTSTRHEREPTSLSLFSGASYEN